MVQCKFPGIVASHFVEALWVFNGATSHPTYVRSFLAVCRPVADGGRLVLTQAARHRVIRAPGRAGTWGWGGTVGAG